MTMSPGTREYVVRPFLAELAVVRLNQSVPLYVVQRRILLAEMVLADVPGDDPEEMAIRGRADALIDLCWSPRDLDVIERYLSAGQTHLDLLRSANPVDGHG